MVATSVTQPKTYQDYLETPDDTRYELIDGELIEMTSPVLLHQLVTLELVVLLRAFVRARNLGRVIISPMDVRLAQNIVVQPDFCFVRKGSPADNPNELRIAGIPDLMVEVLSPSNTGHDLVRKRELYARYHVPEYWIVDPTRRTATALALENGDYVELPKRAGVLASRILPGLEIDLPAFFESAFE